MSVTAAQLLQPWPELAVPSNVADCVPLRLVSDSREVQAGDAFVAIPGGYCDGRQYIEQAVERDAVLVLAETDSHNPPARVDDFHGVPVVYVPQLSQRLSSVAAIFYRRPAQSMPVFAVTGTNGKTTCSHLYAQLRTALGQRCGVIGTIGGGLYGEALVNTGFTTPDAITAQRLMAEFKSAGAQFVSLEASSHSLDQYRIEAIPVHTALFTNLSRDHLDYHADMADYAASKWRLFEKSGLQVAIINVDDVQGREWVSRGNGAKQTLTFSLADNRADVFVSEVEYTQSGVAAQLHTPWGSGRLVSPLIGSFNLSNLLGVITALLAEGVALELLLPLVESLAPVTGRMQLLPSVPGVAHVVIDYAHTPDGLEQALLSLQCHCRGQLWCVFGCGGDRDRGKRPLMAAVAEDLADCLVITNDNPIGEEPGQISADILAGLTNPADAAVILDRALAIRHAINHAKVDDVVLVAGKGHEDYQVIGDVRSHFSDWSECTQAMSQAQEAHT